MRFRRALTTFAPLALTLSLACNEQSPSAPAVPPMPTAPPLPREPPPDPAKSVLESAQTPAPFTPDRVSAETKVMGTHVQLVAFTNPKVNTEQARKAFEAAAAEIKRVEDLMTTWRDSEVFRINAASGKSAVKVGDETFAVIKESIHASEISSGTFDITFETLHGLWKFDEDLEKKVPSEKDLKARLPFVNYKNIVLDEAAHTVKLTKPETKISLGGIAKGYGVDMAVKVLEKAGLASFFVQAGGDLYAKGKKPDGSDWQAGVRDPRGNSGEYFAMIALSDHAFSTAGDYERSFILDGKRYHHILDPRTGYPATACRSVTIYAPTALLADEIDDAVFILGPDKGLQLVESVEGVGAIIVDAKNNTYVSNRLKGKVTLTKAPSEGI